MSERNGKSFFALERANICSFLSFVVGAVITISALVFEIKTALIVAIIAFDIFIIVYIVLLVIQYKEDNSYLMAVIFHSVLVIILFIVFNLLWILVFFYNNKLETYKEGDLTWCDGKGYYYKDGEMVTSKLEYVNDAWRWFDEKGVMMTSGEAYADDAWRYFDEDGAMVVNEDRILPSYAGVYAMNKDGTGKTVHYDEQGRMVKGEYEYNGGSYYFDEETGTMVKGWYTGENGALYYYDQNTGKRLYGEQEILGVPCYFTPRTGVAADHVWIALESGEYWYEEGERQGMEGRGKEIYDPATDAWYWLDSQYQGRKAVDKDVYVEDADGNGKWVRYDQYGYMVRGWQDTDDGTYYFDEITGAMAKGHVLIDGIEYYFDDTTGIMQ